MASHSFIDICNNYLYIVGLKADGSIWEASSNRIPVSFISIPGNHSFIKISCGYTHTIGLKSDGSVWGYAWGTYYGSLGLPSVTPTRSPVQLNTSHSVIDILATHDNTYFLKSDGSIWAAGKNVYGQVGDNTTTLRQSFVSVVGNYNFNKLPIQGTGSASMIAETTDNKLYSWGNNNYYQTAHDQNLIIYSPYSVKSISSLSEIHYYRTPDQYELFLDGTVRAKGSNTYGQLGNDSTVYASPDFVTPLITNVISVYAGSYYVIFLKSDGSAWGTGRNTFSVINAGQLGDGTIVNKSSPVSVLGNHSFIKITGGSSHTLGLKADGSIWGWGRNDYGQLGNVTTDYATSPTSVFGNYSFIDISSRYEQSIGLTIDGSVFGWGQNLYGSFGNGDFISSYFTYPMSMLGNHSFIQVKIGSGIFRGLKSDGTVWSCGYNDYGELGDNTTISRNSPVLMTGNHSFSKILASDLTTYLLKSDGSLWTIGSNYNGSAGINDSVNQHISSPVSVLGNHSFRYIQTDNNQVYMLDENNVLYVLGYNSLSMYLDIWHNSWLVSPTLII